MTLTLSIRANLNQGTFCPPKLCHRFGFTGLYSYCAFVDLRDTYPMILVANKVDLVHLRKITEEQGRELANTLKVSLKYMPSRDPPSCLLYFYMYFLLPRNFKI